MKNYMFKSIFLSILLLSCFISSIYLTYIWFTWRGIVIIVLLSLIKFFDKKLMKLSNNITKTIEERQKNLYFMNQLKKKQENMLKDLN